MDHERIRQMHDAVTSGQLSAKESAPFLAGLIDGAIKNLFAPMTKAKKYVEFDPAKFPTSCKLVLNNGDVLKVTIEQV